MSLQLSKGSVHAWHAGLQWNFKEKVVQSCSVKKGHSEAPTRKAAQWIVCVSFREWVFLRENFLH